MIESCTSSCSRTFSNLTHRSTNSYTCVDVVICARKDLIQFPLSSSWRIVLFFLRASLKRLGARYLGASPSSKAWCQNQALWPLPMVTVVEELNRRRSMSLHGTIVPTHGLESSTHSCHNHRRHSALPNLSRSGTPRPHGSLGMQTVGQLTRQWPPTWRNAYVSINKCTIKNI